MASLLLEGSRNQHRSAAGWAFDERCRRSLACLQQIASVDVGDDISISCVKLNRCGQYATDGGDASQAHQSADSILHRAECNFRSNWDIDVFQFGAELSWCSRLPIVAAQFRLESIDGFVATGSEAYALGCFLTERPCNGDE